MTFLSETPERILSTGGPVPHRIRLEEIVGLGAEA